MTRKQIEQAEALEQIRKFVKPGDTLYTTCGHVSRSGMLREINVYVMLDNQPVWLSGYAATALGERLGKNGIRLGGCGMDMGFSLVHRLSYALHPDGFACLQPAKCPSNDHANREKRDYHLGHGYSLFHAWMS